MSARPQLVKTPLGSPRKARIENGIPIPPLKFALGIYPWHEMGVGDSFVSHSKSANNSVSHANFRYAPKRFTARAIPEGTRTWRIK